MKAHPVSFENLTDWLEGRLDLHTQRLLEEHLAHGCRTCECDLRWLRCMTTSLRMAAPDEPPVELVDRTKALYRSSRYATASRPRVLPLFKLPRRVLARAALVITIAAVALALTVIPGTLAGTAKLSNLQGTAERAAGGGDWEPLPAGAQLRSGDSVRIAEGMAVLTLFEGSKLELRSGSEVRLSVLRSGLLGFAVEIGLNQEQGEIAYDVSALRSPWSSFAVHSPAAVVTVRGTRFSLTVQNRLETRVEVFEGRVEVANELAKQLLTQSEVALVPVSAPLIHLPTLTPGATRTRTPTQTSTPSMSETPQFATLLPSATSVATAHVQMPGNVPAPKRTATDPSVPTETPPPTAAVKPTATATPNPTAAITMTIHPSRTPRGRQVEFEGVIERMPASREGVWVIAGQQILVTAKTEIIGRPLVGMRAKVQAWDYGRHLLEAIRIGVEVGGPVHTPEPGSTRSPQTPGTPRKTTPTASVPLTSTPWAPRTTPTRKPRPTWPAGPTRALNTPVVAPTLVASPTPTATATLVLAISSLSGNQ